MTSAKPATSNHSLTMVASIELWTKNVQLPF
ncbi:hypothetical protein HNQ72_001462 [Rhizobium wenxiniae]|uniref:Uncharacterized protein n=1 Tax=Rhizobium wenxiniae TaxID=1737357 RepID=A0A7X0CYU2_9HYPH|nr:hypothetical protein [Rhizobium wenxiniae]